MAAGSETKQPELHNQAAARVQISKTYVRYPMARQTGYACWISTVMPIEPVTPQPFTLSSIHTQERSPVTVDLIVMAHGLA